MKQTCSLCMVSQSLFLASMLNFCNIFEIEVMTDLIRQIIQTGNKGLEYIFQFFFGTQPDCQPATLTDFQPSTLRGFHFHLLTL